MSKRGHDKALEPSFLPANPSVGELMTEIDRTRHEAARTIGALAAKLEATRPVSPTRVARRMGTAVDQARRFPLLAWLVAVLLLALWWRHRRART